MFEAAGLLGPPPSPCQRPGRVKFLFSHLLMVPQKVLWRSLRELTRGVLKNPKTSPAIAWNQNSTKCAALRSILNVKKRRYLTPILLSFTPFTENKGVHVRTWKKIIYIWKTEQKLAIQGSKTKSSETITDVATAWRS